MCVCMRKNRKQKNKKNYKKQDGTSQRRACKGLPGGLSLVFGYNFLASGDGLVEYACAEQFQGLVVVAWKQHLLR